MASCSGPSGIEGEGTPRDALLDAAADASSGTGACIVDGTTRDDLLDTAVDALLDSAAAPLRMGGTCARVTDQRLKRTTADWRLDGEPYADRISLEVYVPCLIKLC